MSNRVLQACNGMVAGKTIAVLGLTFKPNTDDMRDSPSLPIINDLQSAGAKIRVYDPCGMDEARKLLTDITFCSDSYDAMKDAVAIVIITEWNEFRSLDLERVKNIVSKPVLIDLRNIYSAPELLSAGFEYYSLGRPSKKGD